MTVPRILPLLLVLTVPVFAAPKRRAVAPPAPLDRARLIATATKVADRGTWTYHPRLHWENAVYFDGLVLFAEQAPSVREQYFNRVASILLESDDPIETVWWGDGTAFGQPALDLYRLLPPDDPRRAALLTKLDGPMRFAEHAMRTTPANGAPRDPWWVEGGYGARFWQDDLYMLVPWLSIADLFLLPSAQESFGLAALEAMACEVPVVASKVGGLPEIIEHGVTGFVCPPDRTDEMIDSSVALLTNRAQRDAIADGVVAGYSEAMIAVGAWKGGWQRTWRKPVIRKVTPAEAEATFDRIAAMFPQAVVH